MDFELHPEAIRAIDERSTILIRKITELRIPPQSKDGFPSERPIAATFTDKDIIGDPTIWANDENGHRVLAFIFRNGVSFGLTEASFEFVKQISNQILKVRWARDCLSRKFIEESIIKWCKSEFEKPTISSLSEYIIPESKNSIRRFTIWAPIAHLEVEASFAVGPTRIEPITSAMFHELESKGIESSPIQAEQIKRLFKKLRSEMQGYAAVVLEFEAEPGYAYERGLSVANDVVGLLRFFSNASYIPTLLCPNALLGSEYLPQSQAILLGTEGSFSAQYSLMPKNVAYWRLSKADVKKLESEGLKEISKLVIEEGLGQFERRVRTSVLAFGKGITFPDIADRLVYTLSSLEGLLLKNESEPIQQNLGERMAFLLSKDPATRMKIVELVREAYRMRSQYIHHRISISEENELQSFAVYARASISIALKNMALRAF